MGKLFRTGSVLTATLAGLWLGGSIWSGHNLRQAIETLASQPAGNSGLCVRDVQYNGGLFSARGSLNLYVNSACSQTQAEPQALPLRLNFEIRHLVLPNSLARFTWSIGPGPGLEEKIRTVFETLPVLQGHGKVALDGTSSTDFQLSALQGKSDDVFLITTPLTGSLTSKGKSISYQMQMDTVKLGTEKAPLLFQGLSLSARSSNYLLGLGDSQLKIARIDNPEDKSSLQALAMDSSLTQTGPLVDLVARIKIGAVETAKGQGQDLAFRMKLGGLDADSFFKIVAALRGLQGQAVPTDAQIQQLQQLVGTLVHKGLSVQFDPLQGKAGGNSLTADLTLTLAQTAAGQPLALDKDLSFQGKFRASGPDLPMDKVMILVLTGLAQQSDADIHSTFSYQNGVLTVLDKQQDSAPLRKALAEFSAGFEDGLRGRQ